MKPDFWALGGLWTRPGQFLKVDNTYGSHCMIFYLADEKVRDYNNDDKNLQKFHLCFILILILF
jgi:hypothetical protein